MTADELPMLDMDMLLPDLNLLEAAPFDAAQLPSFKALSDAAHNEIAYIERMYEEWRSFNLGSDRPNPFAMALPADQRKELPYEEHRIWLHWAEPIAVPVYRPFVTGSDPGRKKTHNHHVSVKPRNEVEKFLQEHPGYKPFYASRVAGWMTEDPAFIGILGLVSATSDSELVLHILKENHPEVESQAIRCYMLGESFRLFRGLMPRDKAMRQVNLIEQVEDEVKRGEHDDIRAELDALPDGCFDYSAPLWGE